MADPLLPRKFRFEPLPLFANAGRGNSPWNTVAGRLKRTDLSDRQSLATYKILLEYSKVALAKNRNKLADLAASGQQGSKVYSDLLNKIGQEEKALMNGGGGAAQFPHINYDDFSFPIFEARRENGKLVTASAPMRPYEEPFFEPPWFPRIGDYQQGWIALEVPMSAGRVRPRGPVNDLNSDGNVILYDPVSKMEYDFWQASTELDTNGNSLGAGRVGDQIIRAGSVSAFDLSGLGARRPELEPSGSSRATGLPYLGGALLPEDLTQAADFIIKHALIFTLPSLRYFPVLQDNYPPNWVYPATRTEFNQGTSDAYAMAAGQRIRLKDELGAAQQ